MNSVSCIVVRLPVRSFKCGVENWIDYGCELTRKQRGHGVPYLRVLLSSSSFEEVVIREGLQPRGLPDGEAPTLSRVLVDEIMPVLCDVSRNSGGRPVL